MGNIVSITAQGQISLPIALRRKLGLDKVKKAFVTEDEGKIIVEPVTDLLSMKGVLKHKAKKNMTSEQILVEEQKAISEARSQI